MITFEFMQQIQIWLENILNKISFFFLENKCFIIKFEFNLNKNK